MSRVIETNAFPSVMEVKLRRIRWRQVGLAAVRAGALGLSVLIGAMLLAMLADWWFTIFSTTVRSALTVTSLSLATAVLLLVAVRPTVEALVWTRAANQADAEVPQLEERWTTISHFAKSDRHFDNDISKAMLQQVTSEAVALSRLVEPARVVRAAKLQKVLAVALFSALTLAGFLAVNWQQNSVLLRRFWAPMSDITATQLESVTGDAAIPRGQAIDLVTRLSGMSRDSATLTIITDSDEMSTLYLVADRDVPDTFSHFVDVDDSFRYRVSAGDGRTQWHSITAIDPPELADVRLTVTAPDYVDRPPYQRELLPGRIKAIQGSRLSLEMRSVAELERFELMLTSENDLGEPIEQKLELTPTDDGWYRFESVLNKDLALSPMLHSPYGLTNKDQRTCRIRVIEDKAPVARVISPTDEMSVSPDEVLDITFEAHDDHGIAKAELVVYEENDDGEMEELSVQEIPLDDQQLEKHILAKVQLDLGKYELSEGTQVSYAIRVTDNRMLNLNPAEVAEQQPADVAPNTGDPLEAGGQRTEADVVDSEIPAASSLDAPATTQHGENADLRSDEQMAKGEPSDGPQEAMEERTTEQLAAEKAAKTEGPTATTAESGKEGLQVTKDSPASDEAVASTAGNEPTEATAGETNESAERDLSDTKGPESAVAGKDDASPLKSTEPASDVPAGEKVASQAGDAPAGAGADVDPAESADDPESPTVAAKADKAADSGEDENAAPGGKSLNPGSPSSPSPDDPSPQLAQGNRGGSQNQDDDTSPQKNDRENPDGEMQEQEPRPQSGSIQLSESSRINSPDQRPTPPLDIMRDMQFESQRGQQNTESNRLRLTITDRQSVAAAAGESRQSQTMDTREYLENIDKQLAAAEKALSELNDQPDSRDVPENSRQVDSRLEKAERIIADLRKNSDGTKYEFVGLQMIDIGRAHISLARDRMFVLIQDPGLDPARNILEALHRTSTARELLAALAKRFEAVAREIELAESLEEAAQMYEVYVENMRGVLREAQKNQNPLERKMAVLEVDDAYLDRLAQVLEMEREIMAEFARILADDPRLMGKYMDIIKRRDGNLRNRLTDLHELQEELAYEVSGWMQVNEEQRSDVWIQVAELRLLAGKDLARAATQLESRTLSQLPLSLEPTGGIGATIVRHSKEVALKARQSSLMANSLMNDALENDEAKARLVQLADELKVELAELDAVLEQLAFDREDDEEVIDFTTRRLAESREVAERAIAWADVASQVTFARFHGLAAVDQQQVAVDTEELRVDMTQIEIDLDDLFQQDDVPAEITNIVRELMMTMETITFNQAAATFELRNGRLPEAEAQQTMANEAFERAEELFNQMRLKSVEILDEREVRNPTAADLEDPSLDEFLEQLEREPNLRQLLGIPNRPNNIRVIRDWMLWRAQGNGMGGGGAQAAANAALQRSQMMAQQRDKQERRRHPDQGALTEEELEKFARAENMEEDMEKMLRALEEKMKDPETDAQQRRELQEKAEMLAQMLEEAKAGSLNRERWEELANADETRAMMEALAKGEPIPDSQWNRLMSTLDTGLWQVRGRTPPEDFRKQIEQYQDLLRQLLDEESLNAY